MKMHILATAILVSLTGISTSVNAAQINFIGEVTTNTCVAGGASDISFELPPIAVSEVKKVNEHIGVVNLLVPIECEGATAENTVIMAFTPNLPSTDGKILQNIAQGEDKAEGVGIVVIGADNKALDFDNSAELRASLTTNGQGNMKISAAYALEGSSQDVQPGIIQAVLPFQMTYQ